MAVRTHFHSSGLASIHVDEQHLSRLTDHEVREIVLQCIVFGGKKLREEVKLWLTSEPGVEQIAEYLEAK